jgi:hypothetical protein
LQKATDETIQTFEKERDRVAAGLTIGEGEDAQTMRQLETESETIQQQINDLETKKGLSEEVRKSERQRLEQQKKINEIAQRELEARKEAKAAQLKLENTYTQAPPGGAPDQQKKVSGDDVKRLVEQREAARNAADRAKEARERVEEMTAEEYAELAGSAKGGAEKDRENLSGLLKDLKAENKSGLEGRLATIDRQYEKKIANIRQKDIENEKRRNAVIRELRKQHLSKRLEATKEWLDKRNREMEKKQKERIDARFAAIEKRASERQRSIQMPTPTERPARNEYQKQREMAQKRTDARRQRAQAELDAVQSKLEVSGIDEQTRQRLLDQEKRLQDKRSKIVAKGKRERQRIAEKEKKARIRAATEMAGALSSTMGELAQMQNEKSKEGFERKKKFLYAQAVVDAMSAGISTWQSVLSSGIPYPINYVVGAAQSAAIVATLMAKAKKISDMEPGGGGSGAGGGGGGAPKGTFKTMNSSKAAKRAANFERERRERNQTRERRRRERNDQMQQTLEEMPKKINDKRVILEEDTASEANTVATERQEKLEV